MCVNCRQKEHNETPMMSSKEKLFPTSSLCSQTLKSRVGGRGKGIEKVSDGCTFAMHVQIVDGFCISVLEQSPLNR